jgi:hypothetical protein
VTTGDQEAIRARLDRSLARLTEHANSKPPEQIGGVCILASQALRSLIARTEAWTAVTDALLALAG